MTTAAALLKTLLIAGLLVSVSANAADQSTIQIAMEEGKQIAQFKLGDSRCVLKDDQIRCSPVGK